MTTAVLDFHLITLNFKDKFLTLCLKQFFIAMSIIAWNHLSHYKMSFTESLSYEQTGSYVNIFKIIKC